MWEKAHTFEHKLPSKRRIKFVFLQRSNYISRHEIANKAVNVKAWVDVSPSKVCFLKHRKGIQQ